MSLMVVTEDKQSSRGRGGGGAYNVFHIIIYGDDNFKEDETIFTIVDRLTRLTATIL